MKKLSNCLGFILVFILIASCNPKRRNKSEFTHSSIKSHHILNDGKYLDIKGLTIVNPGKIKYHPKGYLVMLDSKQQDYLVQIINTETNEVQRIVKKGQGLHECINAWNISIVGDDIWVYDVSLNKIVLLRQNADETFAEIEEIKIKERCLRCVAISDSLFVGTPCTKERLAYFNRHGDVVKRVIGFSTKVDKIKLASPNFVFQTELISSPHGDYIAMPNKFIDRLEIYTVTGDKVCNVIGPDNFDPQVEIVDMGIGKRFPLNPRYFTYLDVDKWNDELWALYSGWKLQIKSPNEYAKNIYCFNWEGIPVRKIDLDTDALSFAIDTNRQKLYALVLTPKMGIKEYDIGNIIR
jgi:hypothetical protein